MSDSSVIEVTSSSRLHVSALLLGMSLRQFTDTITDPVLHRLALISHMREQWILGPFFQSGRDLGTRLEDDGTCAGSNVIYSLLSIHLMRSPNASRLFPFSWLVV